jgi:chemotaxis protein CheD
MPETGIELLNVYLQPGEAYLARVPAILRTVLGSCVGVTFWNRRLGYGALCHGVLPNSPPDVPEPEGYRYVDFAILNLVRQLERLGTKRNEMQVKVFGGADVLPVHVSKSRKNTVGYQNWHTAVEVLRKERVHVTVSDVGGPSGRTIQFNTTTGEVLLRRLTQKDGNPW